MFAPVAARRSPTILIGVVGVVASSGGSSVGVVVVMGGFSGSGSVGTREGLKAVCMVPSWSKSSPAPATINLLPSAFEAIDCQVSIAIAVCSIQVTPESVEV